MPFKTLNFQSPIFLSVSYFSTCRSFSYLEQHKSHALFESTHQFFGREMAEDLQQLTLHAAWSAANVPSTCFSLIFPPILQCFHSEKRWQRHAKLTFPPKNQKPSTNMNLSLSSQISTFSASQPTFIPTQRNAVGCGSRPNATSARWRRPVSDCSAWATAPRPWRP